MAPMRDRARFFGAALVAGFGWVLAVAGAVSLVTGAALVALLGLSPWVFAVVVLAVLLVALGEGSYRTHRKTVQERDEARRQAQLPSGQGVPTFNIYGSVIAENQGGGIVVHGKEQPPPPQQLPEPDAEQGEEKG